jgi:hypothetical protein
MWALINRDELVTGLALRMIAQDLKRMTMTWPATKQYLAKIRKIQSKSHLLEIDFSRVNTLLREDMLAHRNRINTRYKKLFRPLCAWLVENFDRLPISSEQWLVMYELQGKGFIKTLAHKLDPQSMWCLPGEAVPDQDTVLIRNIIHNETLLKDRRQRALPFWFVDTGYTNFLTGKKTWHRLVANDLHMTPDLSRPWPADRLHLLPSMPRPWRVNQGAILVVENSESHYQQQGTTLEAWREFVRQKLKGNTDRDIVFRPKNLYRKTRDNLYEHLCRKDYYCVITDASAAAIEAVWAGIPIITLGQHISVPVARNNLANINDLYRGPIGDWLCALTYSQWTLAEMQSGLAVKMIRRYHA